MIFCIFIFILLSSQLAFAQAYDDVHFSEGVNAYLYGDYPTAVERLRPLVQPDVLLGPNDAAKAYEYLGLSFYFLDDLEQSRDYFERLIRLRPDWALDPVLVPAPTITFYNEIQREMEDEIESQRIALETLKRQEEERRIRANTREIIIENRTNSLFVACMPFGLGQFQNDQNRLGIFFLGTEVIAIGLSMGFFVAVEDMRMDNGLFAHEDYEHAKNLQKAQLISGGLAIGLMVGGVLQALVSYRDQKNVQRTVIEPKGFSSSLLSWEF